MFNCREINIIEKQAIIILYEEIIKVRKVRRAALHSSVSLWAFASAPSQGGGSCHHRI